MNDLISEEQLREWEERARTIQLPDQSGYAHPAAYFGEFVVTAIAEIRRQRRELDDVRATLRHHGSDELKISMLQALLNVD